MQRKFLHHPWLRLITAVSGAFLSAVAVNLFIVPQDLYTGGLLGLCQVIRTLLHPELPFDLAGVLYLLLNIPLMVLAWRNLGRKFVYRLILCTVANSLFLAVIPAPAVPIIEDTLTSCVIGGILNGFACGLVLTCGGSCGGLDILGLYFSKRGKGTVGKFSIIYNTLLYGVCALIFSLPVAIYSAIYSVFCSLFIDRLHQQNIASQMILFTKEKSDALPRAIMDRLDRGVTYWEGTGAYTGDGVRVLCICLSKYEISAVEEVLHQLDPHAFFIIQNGVHAGGNFENHLS